MTSIRPIVLAEINRLLSDTEGYGVDAYYACALLLLKLRILERMKNECNSAPQA